MHKRHKPNEEKPEIPRVFNQLYRLPKSTKNLIIILTLAVPSQIPRPSPSASIHSQNRQRSTFNSRRRQMIPRNVVQLERARVDRECDICGRMPTKSPEDCQEIENKPRPSEQNRDNQENQKKPQVFFADAVEKKRAVVVEFVHTAVTNITMFAIDFGNIALVANFGVVLLVVFHQLERVIRVHLPIRLILYLFFAEQSHQVVSALLGHVPGIFDRDDHVENVREQVRDQVETGEIEDPHERKQLEHAEHDIHR